MEGAHNISYRHHMSKTAKFSLKIYESFPYWVKKIKQLFNLSKIGTSVIKYYINCEGDEADTIN